MLRRARKFRRVDDLLLRYSVVGTFDAWIAAEPQRWFVDRPGEVIKSNVSFSVHSESMKTEKIRSAHDAAKKGQRGW
jgi:hypothetical protein